jgi:hypothetical protein
MGRAKAVTPTRPASAGGGVRERIVEQGNGLDDVPSFAPIAPTIPRRPPPRGPGRPGHLPASPSGRETEEKIAAALFRVMLRCHSRHRRHETHDRTRAGAHQEGRGPHAHGAHGEGGDPPPRTNPPPRSCPLQQKARDTSPLPPSLTLSFFRSFSIAPVVSQWCSSDLSYISPLVRDPSFSWRYAIIHTLWALLCAFASSAMALSGGGGGGGGGGGLAGE